MEQKADFAVIGLGVMGQGLATNMARTGVRVIGYDLNADRMAQFAALGDANERLQSAVSLADLVARLSVPRRILLLVPAGAAVDGALDGLRAELAAGDIGIDGGNSLFHDTERRQIALEQTGIHFLGMGVSGGEEGALNGPALMPGGDRSAYEAVKPILTEVAAKASEDGAPCVAYMGDKGAGHFVKMVHNGIEYAEMQVLAECYDLLSRVYGQTAEQIRALFEDWNRGDGASYLLGVSAAVLQKHDRETGRPAVDIILDKAGQKGTGKWTTQSALDLGVAVPAITAALDGRIVSSFKAKRLALAAAFGRKEPDPLPLDETIVRDLKDALLVGRMIGFAQGVELLRAASQEYSYGLDLARIARVWRAGCILRSPMLDQIALATEQAGDFDHLLALPWFRDQTLKAMPGLKATILQGLARDIPLPVMCSAKSYFDALSSPRLPANLIQAQRDYFGAHQFERIDRSGSHHFVWSELD